MTQVYQQEGLVTDHEILSRLIPVPKNNLHSRNKITLKTNLQKDLGADSLDSIETIMAIEEEFGIKIEDAKGETAETVADIVTLIRQKTQPTSA